MRIGECLLAALVLGVAQGVSSETSLLEDTRESIRKRMKRVADCRKTVKSDSFNLTDPASYDCLFKNDDEDTLLYGGNVLGDLAVLDEAVAAQVAKQWISKRGWDQSKKGQQKIESSLSPLIEDADGEKQSGRMVRAMMLLLTHGQAHIVPSRQWSGLVIKSLCSFSDAMDSDRLKKFVRALVTAFFRVDNLEKQPELNKAVSKKLEKHAGKSRSTRKMWESLKPTVQEELEMLAQGTESSKDTTETTGVSTAWSSKSFWKLLGWKESSKAGETEAVKPSDMVLSSDSKKVDDEDEKKKMDKTARKVEKKKKKEKKLKKKGSKQASDSEQSASETSDSGESSDSKDDESESSTDSAPLKNSTRKTQSKKTSDLSKTSEPLVEAKAVSDVRAVSLSSATALPRAVSLNAAVAPADTAVHATAESSRGTWSLVICTAVSIFGIVLIGFVLLRRSFRNSRS